MNPETESKSIHHIALRQPGSRRCAEKRLPPTGSSPPGSPGAGDASAAWRAPSHHARRDGAFRCPDPAIVELLQGEPIAYLTGSEFWSSRKNHARHPDPATERRGWWAGGAHPARPLTIAISARWASRRHRPRAASAPAGDRYLAGRWLPGERPHGIANVEFRQTGSLSKCFRYRHNPVRARTTRSGRALRTARGIGPRLRPSAPSPAGQQH